MGFLTLGALVLSFPSSIYAQQYQLVQTYTPANFFEEFSFYTGQDLTGGFVQYVPFETAAADGLIGNNSDIIYLGVDQTNTYPPGGPGRPSVRLESKLTFTEGLFVLDLTHIPVGCGIWPAFWTVGLGDWPVDGEIDIIENVNDATENNAALHAAGACEVSEAVAQTGTWKSTDCNIAHEDNQGCGSKLTEPYNFGSGFNANGGGVYAMEWTRSEVKIWFFPPTGIPEALSSASSFSSSYAGPDTFSFGVPSATFAGPCSDSFGDKFFNHTIVINTDFCGGWAGGTFGQGDTQCPLVEGTTSDEACVNYVGSNPRAFSEVYWGIKSLRVWQSVPSFETPLNEIPVMPIVNKTLPTINQPGPILPENTTVFVKPVQQVEETSPPETNLVPSVADILAKIPFLPSSLTGCVLDGEPLQREDPTPIDPGIGEGTSSDTLMFDDTLGSDDPLELDAQLPPGQWNTKGRVDNFPPALSLLNPNISGAGKEAAGAVAPLENDTISSALPTVAETIPALFLTTLDDDAQNQLLVLANAFGVGLPPGIVPSDSNPSVNPVPDVVPEEAVPAVPALNTEDTSQAVSGIFDFLDDSTKTQLFSLLAPLTTPSTSDATSDELRRRATLEDIWGDKINALSTGLRAKLSNLASDLTYFGSEGLSDPSDRDAWLEIATSRMQSYWAGFDLAQKVEIMNVLAQPGTDITESPAVDASVPTITSPPKSDPAEATSIVPMFTEDTLIETTPLRTISEDTPTVPVFFEDTPIEIVSSHTASTGFPVLENPPFAPFANVTLSTATLESTSIQALTIPTTIANTSAPNSLLAAPGETFDVPGDTGGNILGETDITTAPSEPDTSTGITRDPIEPIEPTISADVFSGTSPSEIKRDAGPKNFNDFIRHFILQYHIVGDSFAGLSNAEKLQLLQIFTNNNNLDAKTSNMINSADDRVKSFILNTYVFGEFFQTLDAGDKKQLIDLLTDSTSRIAMWRKRQVNSPFAKPVEQPAFHNADGEDTSKDLDEALQTTLDPLGMLALNDEEPEIEEPPPDWDPTKTNAAISDDESKIKPVLPLDFEEVDPFGMKALEDEVPKVEEPPSDFKAADPEVIEAPVLPKNFTKVDPFGMTGLDGVDDDVQEVEDKYSEPSLSEPPTAAPSIQNVVNKYFGEVGDIPAHADENADVTDPSVPDPSTSAPAIPGKKFVDAIKDVLQYKQNEVNGPFTGEMIKNNVEKVKAKWQSWGQGVWWT